MVTVSVTTMKFVGAQIRTIVHMMIHSPKPTIPSAWTKMFVVSAAERTLSATTPMLHASLQAGKQKTEQHAQRAKMAAFLNLMTRPVKLANGACDCFGNFPAFARDCGGNCILDEDGDTVCDDQEIPGCTNSASCNYDSDATEDDGSCLTLDALNACGGDCFSDIDGDLICDRDTSGTLIDDCVGSLDDCDICNGYSTFTLNGSPCAPGTFLDSDGDPCIPGTTGCFSCIMEVIIENSELVVPDYRNPAGERCIPGPHQIVPTKTLTQQQLPHQMPVIVQETPMMPLASVAVTALRMQMAMEYVM